MIDPDKTIPLPSAPLPESLAEEISAIRQHSTRLRLYSETTGIYQDDVLELVARTRNHPGPVLELGVYHGGLSVQLAHVLRAQGRRLICLDISSKMLEIARRHFQSLGVPADHVTFLQGTVADYYDTQPRAAAVIIDADHSYWAARNDLSHVLAHNGDAHAILLHDYNLRVDYIKEPGCTKDYVDVKRAVLDVCGEGATILPIGSMGAGQYIGDGGPYVEQGVSEGAALFPALLPADAFARAASHVACDEAARSRRALAWLMQDRQALPKILSATETMLSAQADTIKLLARMEK